ncbi:MAG: YCF48-related protein [Lysobacteraceae bacterium]
MKTLASKLSILVAVTLTAATLGVTAQDDSAPLLMAEPMPLATSRALVLDLTNGDSRAIAVGERGHVLVSESRSDWRQVEKVPSRSNLTAVTTAGESAWAVGHDGLILFSADGGLTWTVQRQDVWKPMPDDADWDAFDPTQGAPLLDVLALNAQQVIAVGAYSLMLRSDDGGQTWIKIDPNAKPAGEAEPEAEESDAAALAADGGEDQASDDWTMDADALVLDEEDDPHLNGIARDAAGQLMVVGERAAAFRSRDGGQSWERLSLPYDGSMFGVLALGEGHFLAYGLRGHVQETMDFGDTWVELDTATEATLQGGALTPDGSVFLVGNNGTVLYRAAGAGQFVLQTYSDTEQESPVLSNALALENRAVIVAGEKGLGRFQLN